MTHADCSSKAGRDCVAIFQGVLDAIRGDLLVRNAVTIADGHLAVGQCRVPMQSGSRVVVIGAGKASGQMAAGLIEIFRDAGIGPERLSGWINVPDDCVVDLPSLAVFGCRPAGENLPTEKAVEGTGRIISLVRGLRNDDLCICLISGGGSALLTSPAEGITLDDKRQLIRWLDSCGAPIEDRNRIRRELSQVKGGRLARMQVAGTMITLVISDILGDPVELIASGPTVPVDADPETALRLLKKYSSIDGDAGAVPQPVWECLKRKLNEAGQLGLPQSQAVQHVVTIGSIQTAVNAAAESARALGYQVQTRIQTEPGESVSEAAQRLVGWIKQFGTGPRVLIDGGEPTLRLAANPGRGGRNQQLVLDVASRLIEQGWPQSGFCFLSGGTDGEDGTTSVAGAVVDDGLLRAWIQQGAKPSPYQARNDAYSFFERHQGLLATGMTGANVGDLRIAIVR